MKKHLQRSPFARCRAAFSVVEMLIVVAIIGALSAVVISFYGRYHRDVVLRVRDQRNAQEITSLTMGANAAGAEVIAPDDMEQTILNLIEGRNGKVGAFKGHHFGLSKLTAEEIAGAMRYLRWHAGFPSYVPEGVPAVDAGN
ncbi:type IV pilin protein [Brevifollis gellanilyticus]|nr:type II secretion system protein [Brevifollis gellanilyticus]